MYTIAVPYKNLADYKKAIDFAHANGGSRQYRYEKDGIHYIVIAVPLHVYAIIEAALKAA